MSNLDFVLVCEGRDHIFDLIVQAYRLSHCRLSSLPVISILRAAALQSVLFSSILIPEFQTDISSCPLGSP